MSHFFDSAIPLAILAAALAGCATPGVNAAVHRDAARMQEVLSRPNHGGENLDNLMDNSIAFGCADCVRALVKAGVKPGTKALSAAALAGHEDIAEFLIASGDDPEAAMAAIHRDTRKWPGGCCYSPEQAQSASDLFKKIERRNPPRPAAPAPAAPAEPAPAAAPLSSETPSFREANRPDDYALVVGVENYDGLPSAPYADRDAAAAADFLKALGVPERNIATLTGARATRAGLAKRLEAWLPENVAADSTVYFYFAGHGASDSTGGRAYLLPSDGDPQYLELTGYPLRRVYEKMGALKAKRAIVILDAGFSGAGGRSVLAKGADPVNARADAGFNSADGKIALLLAADSDQITGTNAEKGHGLLTGRLLTGLNGAAKDASGRTTLKSLFDYVKPAVADDARLSGRVQIPQFRSGGTATDDVVLRAR
ncbi:MAG: caspase family protein [Elusimicrobiota bacterium]